jgi:hypothetical protein
LYSNNKNLYFEFNFFYAILLPMKKLLFALIPIGLLATSPFETPKERGFDLSQFDTKMTQENIQATKNPTVTCRYVCDKKVYKEQKIAEAISFYKLEVK